MPQGYFNAAVSAPDWRAELNTRSEPHGSFQVKSPKAHLYIRGAASAGNGRIVSREEIPEGTHLAERKTLTVYQDMHHSYIHFHKPGAEGQDPVDTVVGKYARNNGVIKLATSMQDAAAAMPSVWRYTLGIGMICFSKLLMAGRLLCPHQAFVNDEPRLYQQFGQDYLHHPHVTFVLDDRKAENLEMWLNILKKQSREGKYPLRFQLFGNNCGTFVHNTFHRTGFPGSFVDYFDEKALRSRSLGLASSTRDAHGYKAALTRLYRNFIEPWVQWKPYFVYQPNIEPGYIDGLFQQAKARHAESESYANTVSKPPQTGRLESIKAYFCSGSLLGTADRLQKAGRYREARDAVDKQLALLEQRIRDFKENQKASEQMGIITDLHSAIAVARKIHFKAARDVNASKKEA